MKIVIDISKSIIEHLKDGSFGARIEDKAALVDAVMNGAPLPKGHGRLKDADYIKLFSIYHDSWNGVEYEEVIEVVPVIDIDNALTIIEADKENE